MKKNWEFKFGIILIVLSIIFYYAHYLIFHDAHHIFIYMVGDIAFLPIEVLLVSMIIHRLLTEREKRAILNKMNMVIGAFFSEVGTGLLGYFSLLDTNYEQVRKNLLVKLDWTIKDFTCAKKSLEGLDYRINPKAENLDNLKTFLKDRREFLLRLLENPNLLEHESFTELLWAVFHLTEELCARNKIIGLPDSDFEHLAGDLKRVYVLLISEWLDYMAHLQRAYPYLYSLAVRTNPFNPESSPEVRG